MKVFSPAKLNLFLNVLSKRADGYHELHTLFERLSLGDDITLKKRSSGILFGTDSRDIPRDASNLVVRAAQLLRKECAVNEGAEIFLKKRIPVAAGLGGGSSNAATVLLGLNRLWRLKLSRKKLLSLAAQLGSDVPFFVLEAPFAIGEGRGEKLRPFRGFRRKLWHCLVKPPFGISTQEAYKGLVRGKLTPKKTNVRMLVRSVQTEDSGTLSNLLTNSLELSLNKRVTAISDIKKKLVFEGAFAALMSGSGSTVFGLFSSEGKARRAAVKLRKKNRSWKVFVAATY